MKIKLKILEDIIKEEISKVLKESEIQKQLKTALPTILKNKTATKIFKVTKQAVQNKKISVNDFLNVTKGLTYAVKSGRGFADIAVNNPTALQKAGLDIIIGDITTNVNDLSRYGSSRTQYSDYATGGERDFGKTYGVQLKLTL